MNNKHNVFKANQSFSFDILTNKISRFYHWGEIERAVAEVLSSFPDGEYSPGDIRKLIQVDRETWRVWATRRLYFQGNTHFRNLLKAMGVSIKEIGTNPEVGHGRLKLSLLVKDTTDVEANR